MSSSKRKISKIVEYFVIKNPAQKYGGDKITNFSISFKELGIIKTKKTAIIQHLKNDKHVIITKSNNVKEIVNIVQSLAREKEIVVIKKECFSQLDELFRVVRNGLAHGNFHLSDKELICYSKNKKDTMNGYVRLRISTYLSIIQMIFGN